MELRVNIVNSNFSLGLGSFLYFCCFVLFFLVFFVLLLWFVLCFWFLIFVFIVLLYISDSSNKFIW